MDKPKYSWFLAQVYALALSETKRSSVQDEGWNTSTFPVGHPFFGSMLLVVSAPLFLAIPLRFGCVLGVEYHPSDRSKSNNCSQGLMINRWAEFTDTTQLSLTHVNKASQIFWVLGAPNFNNRCNVSTVTGIQSASPIIASGLSVAWRIHHDSNWDGHYTPNVKPIDSITVPLENNKASFIYAHVSLESFL